MRSAASSSKRAACSPAVRRRVLHAVTTLLTALVVGCGGGGGTESDVASPPPAVRLEIVGTVTPGDDPQINGNITVSARGATGIARTSDSYGAGPANEHRTGLTELGGPYMLRSPLVDGSFLVSVATRPGRANLTPLTTLLVAQLLGADPATAYDNYGSSAADAIARITDANIAAAQAKVTDHLQQTLGITVASGAASFTEAAFVAAAGDAMFDTIVALNVKLAADGSTLASVSATLAAESRLCLAEKLGITVGGRAVDFCPQGRSVLADAADASVIVYGFTNSKGETLTLRARDAAVLGARFVAVGGDTYDCSAAACGGLTLGAPDADGARAIAFAAVRLTGAAGVVTLDGQLQGNKPGAAFPLLPCSTNRYFIVYPGDRVDAACAAGDTTIGAGIGDASRIGDGVRYLFQSDGAFQPLAAALEVRANGQDIASLFVQDINPDTGETRGLYKCRGAACNGVTIGPARDDPDSFAPYILRYRTITIADAVLPAVNADGTLSAAGPVTVRAEIDSFEIVFPPEAFPPTTACWARPDRLTVQLNDVVGGTTVATVCPPADIRPESGLTPDDFITTTTFDGPVAYSIFSSNGQNKVGGVSVNLVGDAIDSITYDAYPYGPTYSCVAAACTGVVVSAPDGAGQRTVTFSGAVLQELEAAGLSNPGRTATVNGSFVAPPL